MFSLRLPAFRNTFGPTPSRSLTPAWVRCSSSRPSCYIDPVAKEVHLEHGIAFKPKQTFFDEVADPKSISDAPKYVNNIERYVGTVKVPVGLLGPLGVRIIDDTVSSNASPSGTPVREFFLPMATTEGALLASYNRGVKAITLSGGATATVIQRQMIRAPVFMFERVADASRFLRWVRTSGVLNDLKKKIDEQPHCHVVELYGIQTDRCVHIHIGIDSEDAAGQNMVTYCGRVVMEHIREVYKGGPIEKIYIEGGFNSGKRGSYLHLSRGKGLYAVVDCVLTPKVLKEVLHTTASDIMTFQKLHQRSSSFIGTLSLTAHVANGLTAFFIANGQDPACTAESQAAVTNFELRENPAEPGNPNLYASMTLPSLIVSTLGGGTGLPSQKACLDVIGVEHPKELACVVAAMCLSGELSFYAAMVSGEFDKAHWNATHKMSL